MRGVFYREEWCGLMKVLLVDDEPVMLLAMKRMLATMEDVEVVGSFQNAADALDYVRNKEVDLAFVDIMIDKDNGLDLARSLRLVRADLDIVFTTSHSEFALQSFDVYPLDYMVKPVSKIRLAQTIARAISKRSGSNEETVDNLSLSRLTIRGFGSLEVGSNQAGAVKWISKKSMELFAYLLVQRGRSVSKNRVLEDVFNDLDTKNAETYLNTAIYQLRKALSPHGFKEVVVSAQEQYSIVMDRMDVDFIQFEQAAGRLEEILEENDIAAAIEIEKSYTSRLFEDHHYAWAVTESVRLSAAYLSYANQLANLLLVQKRFRDAAQIASRAVAFHEFDEETNQLLLQIYGAMGDRHSLRTYYEQYTKSLQQELGLLPSATIQQLYEHYQ
jgi:two-component SAPR family response regulator